MIVKVHKSHDGKAVIALCDSNLLGKKFEQDNLQLDLTSEFYKGEEKTKEEIIKLLKQPCHVNAVGEECINFLKEKGLISKENIIIIANIPHVELVLVE
ncbi:DUF424 family protein [Candidatus Woesearchaeota archaeon]|nr:DUF424 family protein [Candidatus Woesearchaeota archaeon]